MALSLDWKRYQLVDYLDIPVAGYEFRWRSAHPKAIASYETLLVPFDAPTWSLTLLSVAWTIFVILLGDWIHFAVRKTTFPDNMVFEGLAISFVSLIQESLPQAWFQRNRWCSKYLMLFIWLLTSFVLGQAYKSNLLAILATKRYEPTIETAEDFFTLDRTLIMPNGTILQSILLSSARPILNRLYWERGVARGGLYEAKGLSAPDSVSARILKGKAGGIGTSVYQKIDGHR